MRSSGRDVVIVGGGPAGITTALAVARLAPAIRSRLIVLESETYPRDKYCAGAIGRRGTRILEDLEALPETPSAPIDGISFRGRGGEIAVRVGGIGRVVRRIEFDHALARIAIAHGIEIQEGTRVLSVTPTAGGATVETSRGKIEARVVVGADGVGSVVRRALGLGKGALRAQVLELDTEPVASDKARDLIHFDASDRTLPGYIWDFPTVVGGEALVCRGIYHLRMGDEQVDMGEIFATRLAAIGLDIRKYPNKRYAERGYEPASKVAGGAIMLVGEAAGIDPVTGEGIAQAIEYGSLAGRFLAECGGVGSVEGWTDRVRRSRLARDLAVRTRAVQMFYGPARPRMERFLLSSPTALHLGCQHFAALPLDRGRLVGLALRGGAALLAGAAASLVRSD